MGTNLPCYPHPETTRIYPIWLPCQTFWICWRILPGLKEPVSQPLYVLKWLSSKRKVNSIVQRIIMITSHYTWTKYVLFKTANTQANFIPYHTDSITVNAIVTHHLYHVLTVHPAVLEARLLKLRYLCVEGETCLRGDVASAQVKATWPPHLNGLTHIPLSCEVNIKGLLTFSNNQ